MSEGDERATPDLSKIVGLIMENPRLIDEISSLVKKSENENPEPIKEDVAQPDAHTVNSSSDGLKERAARRTHLLGALKPYVSKERARAIDTMISISEMLDVMKVR